MKNFIKDNIINILILGVLSFIAFQLFTINLNVTDVSTKVGTIKNNTLDVSKFRNLPSSKDVQNVEGVLDDILRCSDNYTGLLKPLGCK